MAQAFNGLFSNRKVLVTGHTGFKGGWLAVWLRLLGADVVGFSLPPPEQGPSLFQAAGVEADMVSVMGDIRDAAWLESVLRENEPEIVFHLAAQSLVRRSYRDPAETYATNVMGTVHLFEAVRKTPSVRVVINVTSDKCYENREWAYSYRESDPMGGSDPYSSSKGCAELVTSAYRLSFFHGNTGRHPPVPIVHSVRAGNVIGGGDWAEDRLLPDCMKALSEGKQIALRNPDSVRPWQFVLETLSGYLWLSARLWEDGEIGGGKWNFGPHPGNFLKVREIGDLVVDEWGAGKWVDVSGREEQPPKEAVQLRLDCTLAATVLKWRPIYEVRESITETVAWYRNYYQHPSSSSGEFTARQIENYVQRAVQAGLPWAGS